VERKKFYVQMLCDVQRRLGRSTPSPLHAASPQYALIAFDALSQQTGTVRKRLLLVVFISRILVSQKSVL
jgi:hypothetical protein